MGIPFKSGFDLAKYFGYGDLYAAAKKKDEANGEMLEDVKKMMHKINELDKRNIKDKLD